MKRKGFLLIAVMLWALALSGMAEAEDYVEDRTGQWTGHTDAMPSDSVYCRTAFLIPGGREYTIRSDFSPGVAFRTLKGVRCDDQPLNASSYTLLTGRFAPEGGFALHLSAAFAPVENVRLEIEYTVYLTEKAEEENVCALTLVGEGESVTSPGGEIEVFGFELYRAVVIPDGEKQSNPLSGACYSLYYDRDLTERVAFFQTSDGVYMACAAGHCAHKRHAFLMRTGEKGTICIRGLSSGVYYLLENRTPEGHVSMAPGTEIAVSASGGITAGGVPIPEGRLELLERPAGQVTEPVKKDPLAFYIYGSRVLSGLLAAMVAARKKLFS